MGVRDVAIAKKFTHQRRIDFPAPEVWEEGRALIRLALTGPSVLQAVMSRTITCRMELVFFRPSGLPPSLRRDDVFLGGVEIGKTELDDSP